MPTENDITNINQYLQAVKSDDNTAENFNKLYESTFNHIKYIASSNLDNQSDLDDVIMETFYKIYLRIHSFNPNKNGYNWICKITQHTAWDYNKKSREHPVADIDVSEICDDDNQIERIPDRVDVNTLLQKLSPINKQIAEMRFFQGLTLRHIARRLRITQSAVCQRLEKIRNFLKQFVSDET